MPKDKKKGFAIWITGTPASGKSTIAAVLRDKLCVLDMKVQVLESDELRRILTPAPTYSEEEREHFYNILAYFAKLLVDNGVNVIIDATANKKRYRDKARVQIQRFMEVYVKCPTEVCVRRDPKDLYRAAKKGDITTLPGIQSGYEPPENPHVTILSDRESPEEAVRKIVKELFRK